MSSKTHYRTCNICDALCGVAIEYDDEKIISIKGDKNDPFSKGYICPKATALEDLQYDPDRLRVPHKRVGKDWVEISWEEAFDMVAANIKALQSLHGKDTIGVYLGNPNAHNHGSLLGLKPLMDAIGTSNRFSATSVDQLPHMLASMKLFGNTALFPIPDVDRARFLLILGGNPLASGGSFMSGPDIKKRFTLLKKRKGGRLVVIDPRLTETAEIASEHHFITPGKDAFLLLAMMQVIFSEGLENTGTLPIENMNILKGLSMQFSPDKVENIVGIRAEVIVDLAHALAEAEQGAIYGRMGTSTQEFGSLSTWLIYVLNIITNNLDKEGCMMFNRPAIDIAGLGALSGEVNSFNTRKSRVRNLPSFAGEFPAATIADEILTPGAGQIRGMLTLAGNPVLSVPNGTKMEEAFSKLEFMASFDMYINETTRFASVIIPPTGPLEHGHYDLAIQLVAYRNQAKYSQAMLEPPEGAYHDWQSMAEVTSRLNSNGKVSRFFAALSKKYVYWLGDEGMLDLGLKMGPYGRKPVVLEAIDKFLSKVSLLKIGSLYEKGRDALVNTLKQNHTIATLLEVGPYGSGSFPVSGGLSIKTLKRNPHGIDIGPLMPVFPNRLATKNKTINLDPDIYGKDINRIAAMLEKDINPAESEFDLLLIGRRHIRSNNSWLHNSYRLVKGKNRCTVLMHKEDAQARKLSDGEEVRVSTSIGDLVMPLEVAETIKPGVISIPHGWGHHREDTKLSVAQEHAGVSVNDITDEKLVEQLTGTAIVNGVPVKVSAL